jgi:hypothetical protein
LPASMARLLESYGLDFLPALPSTGGDLALLLGAGLVLVAPSAHRADIFFNVLTTPKQGDGMVHSDQRRSELPPAGPTNSRARAVYCLAQPSSSTVPSRESASAISDAAPIPSPPNFAGAIRTTSSTFGRDLRAVDAGTWQIHGGLFSKRGGPGSAPLLF